MVFIPLYALDLPDLDSSDEILAGSFAAPHVTRKDATHTSSSPFIESKAAAYWPHVVRVMGGREEGVVEFRELLPPEATKKTASVAFSHILSKHSSITLSSAVQ